MIDAVTVVVAPPSDRRASWPDALIMGVRGLPLPAWLSYLILTGISIGVAGLVWREFGVPGAPVRWPALVLVGAQVIYPLAASHWLDEAAARAFARFRPLLGSDGNVIEDAFRRLPSRGVAIATVLGVAFGAFATVVSNESAFAQMGLDPTRAQPVIAGVLMVTGITWGPFVYRAVRCIRMVIGLHQRAVGVDPLRPAPAHAFAGWTMRLALVLAIFGYSWIGIDPGQEIANPAAAISEVGFILLAVACFVLPLWGMRQRLAGARTTLLEAASERLERTTAELHARVDVMDLRDADALNKTIGSLIAEREVLLRTGTWPWEQGTLNTLVTVIGAPIALFVLTRLLGKLL